MKFTGKKLISPSTTRWNITFLVLERLLDVKDAVIAVCTEQDWLASVAFEWTNISKFRDLLRPFFELTNFIQGDKVATVSRIIPSLEDLKKHLLMPAFISFAPVPEQLTIQLNERFSKYLDGDDLTYIIATMFDPLMSQYLTPEQYEMGKKAVERLAVAKALEMSTNAGTEISASAASSSSVQLPFSTLAPRRTVWQTSEELSDVQQQLLLYIQILDTQKSVDADAFKFWA
uniref:Uncharacterized protein n=1 Tax=Plectus sambesii TaxID=2011161 RepID=A0A914VBN3_9BILA